MSNAEFDIGETLRKRLEEISVKKNSIGVSQCWVSGQMSFDIHLLHIALESMIFQAFIHLTFILLF